MTPADRLIIEADAVRLTGAADEFATEFYATLFELEPSLRQLFPERLDEQRAKLVTELDVLVARALDTESPDDLARFDRRARDLGSRHELYGVEAPMYELVGVALVGALAETLDDFDDDHILAWQRLYRLVAATMQSP